MHAAYTAAAAADHHLLQRLVDSASAGVVPGLHSSRCQPPVILKVPGHLAHYPYLDVL